MLRHTIAISELRFFDADNPAPMARYDVSCLVMWEQPTIVWIRMMSRNSAGEGLSRKLLREFVQWLGDMGIEAVRSRRGVGHMLPLARLQADGSYLNIVSDLAFYVSRGAGKEEAEVTEPRRRAGESDWRSTPIAPLARADDLPGRQDEEPQASPGS